MISFGWYLSKPRLSWHARAQHFSTSPAALASSTNVNSFRIIWNDSSYRTRLNSDVPEPAALRCRTRPRDRRLLDKTVRSRFIKTIPYSLIRQPVFRSSRRRRMKRTSDQEPTMNFQPRLYLPTGERPLPFECVCLLLQGGGALGAYQGGVYEALAEADIHPDWMVGISIGAINAAIIAGNPPNSRVDRLREFWTHVTSSAPSDWLGNPFGDLARSDDTRNLLNQMSANLAVACGATGFFSARAMMPWLQPGGTLGATSFYDTGNLKHTLERLVDFDRLNAGMTRFSAGAVNVRTGNFVYFDTKPHKIAPEHVMASGALPPGFPAVEIDG